MFLNLFCRNFKKLKFKFEFEIQIEVRCRKEEEQFTERRRNKPSQRRR
jgi:hypothetical protein